MKKLFSLAIAIMILTGLARAGTLKLVKPNGGEKWAPGSSRQILWTADGVTAKVKLILYRNGSKLGRIVGGLNAGSGAYAWTTGNYEGGSAPLGDGYTIRVQTVDDAISDECDAPFSIGEAGTSGGMAQLKPRPGPNDLHIATPDLSGATTQPPLAVKIPRIERIDPSILLNTPGPTASAIGGGFGASPGEYIYLVAEPVINGLPYKLTVLAWSDNRIDFARSQWMNPGEYKVYIAREQIRYQPLSNKVPLTIDAKDYTYVNSVSPGSIAAGDEDVVVEIEGWGFDKPHDSCGAVLKFNGIPRVMSVDSWSGRLIRGRFSTLLIPAGTPCAIFVYMVKGGVTYNSNSVTITAN